MYYSVSGLLSFLNLLFCLRSDLKYFTTKFKAITNDMMFKKIGRTTKCKIVFIYKTIDISDNNYFKKTQHGQKQRFKDIMPISNG